MLWRVVSFLLVHVLAACAGWLVFQLLGALIGWMLVSVLWICADSARAYKTLGWLRHSENVEIPHLFGVWGDVVERVRRQFRARDQLVDLAERRLSEFLAAIQASPNGVVLLDKSACIEWCNQTAAQHFGFDAQRDVLQQIGNLVREPAFSAYMASGDFSTPVTMMAPHTTAARPVRLAVQIHPYGDGRSLLLSNDITALEQAEAMRRDFVANVSHEIRTPLTVLSGFVETLQTLPLDDAEREHYLSLMAQQSLRMQNLVNDLLTLSRLEGSPPPGLGEWTPVSTLMVQCEQEARALSGLRATKHQFSFQIDTDCALAGAATELLSAWSNLVNNAVRYTPQAGHITVKWVALADGRGEFTVQDSGPGIAAEHLPRLTERFYRVDRSRSRDTGGTGLGLAIVKHVVQRHGAELLIESTPGQGSRFCIRMPHARVQAIQRERLVA